MEQRLQKTIVFHGDVDFDTIYKTITIGFAGTIIVLGDLVNGTMSEDGEENPLCDLILPEADILVTGKLAVSNLEAHDIMCGNLGCNIAKLSGMCVVNKDVICTEITVASDLYCEFIEAEEVSVGGDFSCLGYGIDMLKVMGSIEDRDEK